MITTCGKLTREHEARLFTFGVDRAWLGLAGWFRVGPHSSKLEVVQDFRDKTGREGKPNVFLPQRMSLSLNSLDRGDVIEEVAIRM